MVTEAEVRRTRPAESRRTPLRELAALLGLPESDDATEVTGVTLSTDRVLPGDLYAALPGARVHGASFAGAAVASGAVAVLTDAAGAEIVADAGSPRSSSSRRAPSWGLSPPMSTAIPPGRCG